MNRSLLNLSSDVIIKLSTKCEIEEFNPEAEKFFGKKGKETLTQSFIRMFIPEEAQNKVSNSLKKLLNGVQDGRLKMQVLAAGGKRSADLWSVYLLHNKINTKEEIVLALKRQTHE
jgi:PAS domain S-box-containing protein